ncbi:methyltransferase domain-containing protein [Haloplanus sp.]|uniref:methyltransferase domain-containing protein n=1 Tax=Haloplanus sp. TaxID=1961696 RepID=UPI00260BD107|nr:methyltransferase domain-containing protein [Haloplanus sp.]
MYGLELAGEDDVFAAREAACAATAVDVVGPGLATARGVDTDRLRTLAYTHRAISLLGRCEADVSAAQTLVAAADFDRSGSVAVRARDVRSTAGTDTRRAERVLGSTLVDRGFAIDLDDPDHELRACFSADTCLVGWLAAESVREYGDRRPTDRPFFQPGSMAPLDARALANLAGAAPGRTILDPMCGTGGTLIEAGLAGARPVGVDAQRKMVRGAGENLRAYLDDDFVLLRGDATRLPLVDDAVDGVVFDAPYGRQSKIARHDLSDLVAGALGEARRVAPRAVVVADRSWAEAAKTEGWTVDTTFQRRVHASLTRHVHLLTR